MITLQCEDMTLVIDPDAGGSVVSLQYKDSDLLRPGPTERGTNWNPLDYAAFPLVPFSGRIANGKFSIGETVFTLPPNLPPEPHAIHGHGWKNSWSIAQKSPTSIRLVYHHTVSAWPWDYHAHQTFTLSETALSVELSLTNNTPRPMPAGLGWHPYFPRKDAHILAPTEQIWLSGDDMIPAEPTPVSAANDLRTLRAVEGLNLDNAFQTTGQISHIHLERHALEMHADPIFKNMIVYVPPGMEYFCVEPVSHAPDAVNSALPDDVTGLKWLGEGETLSGSIRLKLIV